MAPIPNPSGNGSECSGAGAAAAEAVGAVEMSTIFNPEEMLSAARARTRAAKSKHARLRAEDGTAAERREFARLEADTRMVKQLTGIFRRRARRLHLTPDAISIINLPSGARHVLHHASGEVKRGAS